MRGVSKPLRLDWDLNSVNSAMNVYKFQSHYGWIGHDRSDQVQSKPACFKATSGGLGPRPHHPAEQNHGVSKPLRGEWDTLRNLRRASASDVSKPLRGIGTQEQPID